MHSHGIDSNICERIFQYIYCILLWFLQVNTASKITRIFIQLRLITLESTHFTSPSWNDIRLLINFVLDTALICISGHIWSRKGMLCSSWTDKKIIKKKKLFMKFQKLRGFLFDAYFSFVKNYTIRQLNVDSNKTSTPTISIYCKLQWYECMNRVPCSFIVTTITKLLTHFEKQPSCISFHIPAVALCMIQQVAYPC